MENRRRNIISGFIVGSTFLIGGIMGWIGGSYITPVERVNQTAQGGFVPGVGGAPEVSEEVVPYTTTVSDFRVRLNSLLKEHGIIASEYLKNVHDGKDATMYKNQLSQNAELIAGIVEDIYGRQARGEFVTHWNRHVVFYEDYAKALGEQNTTVQNEAREALLSHADEVGRVMQEIDRNFSQARISDLMREHVRLTLDVIDAYAVDDNEQLAVATKRAYDQAGEFADYLGQAIAASNPNILQ